MVRSAVIRFAILIAVTLLFLAVGTALVSSYIAKDRALRDARARSEAIARDVAAPLVTFALRNREPEAMGVLDAAMRNRIRYGSVSHILLWDTSGRVLWAEDSTVMGKQFDFPPELREVAQSGGTLLEEPGERVSHPGLNDNEAELLEIYVSAVDADGEPFVFEAYLKPDRIDEDYRAVLAALLPVSLLILLLPQLATLPLALSLARQIDRANAHRSAILKRSLESWHEERHLMAQELHDGVIQDLAGMSYALYAVVDQLPEDGTADSARATGHRMNEMLVRSLASLRSMMLDLAPATVRDRDLVTVLKSLCQHMSSLGHDITFTADPDLDVGENAGGLIYRVVREGLRNVHKHAEARTVLVSVGRHGDVVEILIHDDGRGMLSASGGQGHVGLRLLGHTVRDVGGTIALENDPRGGASLRVVLPAMLPDVDD